MEAVDVLTRAVEELSELKQRMADVERAVSSQGLVPSAHGKAGPANMFCDDQCSLS